MPLEPESPSLEQALAEYLGSSSDSGFPDLRRLLAERPEVVRQLRKLLDDHERAGADRPASFDSGGRGSEHTTPSASQQHEAPTLLPHARESAESPPEASGTIGVPGSRFGDYQLIDEIARGGMGVVYRARQISLDRPVALKMILSGHLATAGDVARFYGEAESAARLDHPGIVPIFEVGEQENQHFYAMGFIEGSSLADRVRKGPLNCPEAAEFTRQLAEAVEYAHQRRVIHRDLKPENILLDAQDQVRVTDFGLAKRVDHDSQLTATGQVLGTPSYMPPEQASGRLDMICPASDVYSLGAVLYAMLTGRPPIQASTPVDTLVQVLERDPIPPRQLNANVDRDLETICMKCLQKDIANRYATAREVVAEIERYQRGEPLMARPVSPWELLWRWHTRLRENKVVRVRSSGGIGRTPWVDIAIGPDAETGETRGVARGVIAIGDTAWGVFAHGESARGVVAFGETAWGGLAIGTRAIGLISIGAVGLGIVSISGLSLGLIAIGGLAAGWVSVGGIVIGQYAFGALALGEHVSGFNRSDEEGRRFFGRWLRRLFGSF